MAVLKKAAGLVTNPNEILKREGSLEAADNVVIDSDNVIESRRGFADFGQEFGIDSDRLNQVFPYKGRMIRHYDDTLEFDSDGSGNFQAFSGTYEQFDDIRIKSQESGGNLYFTTNEGIHKMSARNANDLTTSSGFITQAGIPKALDIEATFNATSGGFLAAQSKVGYRLVWGKRDRNNFLLLGAPSGRFVLSNTNSDTLVAEEFTLEFTSNNTSDYTGGSNDYYILFSSETTDYFIYFIDGTNTDQPLTAETVGRTAIEVDLSGFSDSADFALLTANTLNQSLGDIFNADVTSSTITVTSKQEGEDLTDAQSSTALTSVTTTVVTDGSTTTGAEGNADIVATIPDEVDTTDYFYQLYRTSPISPGTGQDLDDVDPGDEMNLVFEANVTSAELSSGTVSFTDTTTEIFRDSGAFLYTNPDTGQGILQANEQPPIAKDIQLFNNTMFYANTKTRHRLNISLLGVVDFTAGTSNLIIGDEDTFSEYTFDTTEDVATQQVLLSGSASPAEAIDETARSLVKVINRDSNSPVRASYTSGPDDLPGQILLESRNLREDGFFLGTSDSAITDNFDPNLPEVETITSISSSDPTQITSTGHGLVTGDEIYIYDTDSTPAIQGLYQVTVVDSDNFTVDEEVTSAGSSGFWFLATAASDNEIKPNRVYFSKIGQYESVPLLNYIDVGPQDKKIQRILALRDSLFVLKEDGIYIVTGSTSPNFGSRLLDASNEVVAPDAADVLNNRIYCLTTQGIVSVSDGGIQIISRPIENLIFDVVNSRYSYQTISFGVGYEGDRAYYLWLPTRTSDTVATQCYRYHTFTRTWTRWTIPATCGSVNIETDKLFLGSGENNLLFRERRNDDRTDFSDRDFSSSIINSGTDSEEVELTNLVNVEPGDVLLQTQYVTISEFNRLLLKLDLDPNLDDTDYFSTLEAEVGDILKNKLDALNAKLVSDDSSGVISSRTFSSDFETIQTEYNTLIDELNDASSDTFYKDYKKSTDTKVYEGIIQTLDEVNNRVTLNYTQPFWDGDCRVYNHINHDVQWAPLDFGQPDILKQVRDGTFIFDQNNFYDAIVSYASDRSANFEGVTAQGSGTGTWGGFPWGENTWSGEGNEVPIRTLVPKQKQRCRYLKIRFEHKNAREGFRIVGVSLDPRPLSTRAYR